MAWAPAVISAIGSIAGGLFGSHGAHKAADDQLAFEQKYLAPYFQAGQTALPQLEQLLTQQGRAGFLNKYFDSPEFKTDERAAQESLLANASAGGNLGSAYTQGALAHLAPQLGQQALNQQFGNLSSLARIGFGGASQLASQGGNLVGQAAAAPYQGLAQGFGGATNAIAQQMYINSLMNNHYGQQNSFGSAIPYDNQLPDLNQPLANPYMNHF